MITKTKTGAIYVFSLIAITIKFHLTSKLMPKSVLSAFSLKMLSMYTNHIDISYNNFQLTLHLTQAICYTNWWQRKYWWSLTYNTIGCLLTYSNAYTIFANKSLTYICFSLVTFNLYKICLYWQWWCLTKTLSSQPVLYTELRQS